MAKKKTKKEKWWEGLYSKIIVLGVIGLNIWFADRVFDVVESGGAEPAALVVAFFGFTTGELWLLASVKKNKDKIKGDIEINSMSDE